MSFSAKVSAHIAQCIFSDDLTARNSKKNIFDGTTY